jgi:CheY-like chemotaxis protein
LLIAGGGISKALRCRSVGFIALRAHAVGVSAHAVNYQPRLLHSFLLPPLHAGLVIPIGGNMANSRSQPKGWDVMKKPPGLETALNIVLSVSPNDDDCASLERIFKSDWTVIASATVASALSVLREIPIPIVICDCEITSGTWEEMLDHVSLLPDPPLVIVTSRLADERLWAEALNLGAWDVLAKPFDADEVIRIVGIACQHWQDRHSIYISRTRQKKPAIGTGHLAATGA